MIEKVIGCALEGIEAQKVEVEVNISRGAKFLLVGLPDNAVKESHYRISAALKNIGFKIPVKEIIINLAPADLKKEGSSYDLPIALGILCASGQIKLGLFNFITCNGGTKINKKLFNSNSNELIVFDNKFKHHGITQTDTPTRINLNIAWK